MKKNPVVITGASGFIGSHLVSRMREHGYTLFPLIHKNRNSQPIPGVEEVEIPLDCRDLISLFQEIKPAGIIHLATCFRPAHTPEIIPEMIRANVEFGTILLESAVKSGVKWFLNTGTFWQNYEGKCYDPVNLYAATKQALESIFAYYRTVSQIQIVTLCLNDTYGSGDTRKKIFPLWKELMEHPERKMQMSAGEQIMDVLHVNDVVDGFLLLTKMLEEEPERLFGDHRFYLSAKERYSLRELAGIFEKVSGKTLNIEWGARPYREREVMDPRCYGKPLPGWENRITLEEGISRFLKG